MNLPQKLIDRLKDIFSAYPDAPVPQEFFDRPHYKGLRVNTLKTETEKFLKFGITGEKSPFCRAGYYIGSEEKLGNHPLHHAGAFYLQEPSATSAVTVLDVQPGDFVLDLCAAPGGKSTQIAAELHNTGLVWSNEIVGKRANILLSNFERIGVARGVVSSCHPDKLCDTLQGCFDKVLVDAPCSGEGMLRREPQIATEWTEENVIACADRQLKILDSAAAALREGGVLVYSTCTYSREENEENVKRFLVNHPEFQLLPIDVDFGRQGIDPNDTRRVLWCDGGEGHFVAKFRKLGDSPRREIPAEPIRKSKKGGKTQTDNFHLTEAFLKENHITLGEGHVISKNGKYYLSPLESVPADLGVIRSGVLLGEEERGRFTPAHAMFATPYIQTANQIDLELSDQRLQKFLHGEEIEASGEKGFYRVAVEGIPLGFGKLSEGRLKNYYPKGLRTLY